MRRFSFIFLLLVAATSFAAEPSVTAVLSNSETAVGQPVELQIQITGASNPKQPGEIKIDGLDIRSAGVSRQYQMQNFSVSYSFTYNYNIMPLKAGSYKIPPQSVEAGGKTFRTPELTLNVVPSSSSGQAARGSRGNTSAKIDPSQIGFLEIVLPKAIAYVGEMIPLQTRIGINARTPVQSPGEEGLQIPGQGFTMQKPSEQSRHTVENVNGKTYDLYISNTAIAPVRSGKIEIGPAVFKPIVRVPMTQRNPSLPRDIDDMFNNFFDDPAFAPSVPKQITLSSEPVTLEVKPLPQNAPSTFSGAVGTFILKVEAVPKKAQVGDPITVTATLIGRGNFDRVTAPALADENGWHKYPPSEKFTQDDDVGISGTKTFETVFTAKENKNKLPPLVFSYFDPVKETYVTLQSEAIPLAIQGGAAPSATPAVAAAPSTTAAPSAAVTPAPKKEDDILYQLTERPAMPQTFAPLYERRTFWLWQIVPLVALLGLIGWKIRAQHSDNREAQRIARLQQEAAELQRKLRREDALPNEYFADASRAVQLKAALARNVDPNAVDADSAANAFQLDEAKREKLRQLFSESDEMRYSGGQNGGRTIAPEKRREILELVENLR